MCGIVGFYSGDPASDFSGFDLRGSCDILRHRGPDDSGVFFYSDNDVSVGLGHQRLSIIDISPRGHQPMSISGGDLTIVFNGEIFNFTELRIELKRSGLYQFFSDSDTEVLLYSILEWGLDECLRKIRGMYAFALFDRRDSSLTLVRDSLGVKPFYYWKNKNNIVFASEIKAILRAPHVNMSIDYNALSHYLTFSNAPAPMTFFEGIKKLEAGCYLRVGRGGACSYKRFWEPTFFKPDAVAFSEEYYVDVLQNLLRQAVARRMISDAPFGAFLSGGLDSSLNVALMAEMMDRPVETFSIGIEGDSANEFPYAQKVAERFGTHHHEIVINDDDFLAFLPRMPFYQDEPLADPVCVPLYYVSELARKAGVKVIQVGEGSDEIFSGYQMYHYFNDLNQKIYKPYLNFPVVLRSLFYQSLKSFLAPELRDSLRRAANDDPLFLGNAIAFWDCEKNGLLLRPLSAKTSSDFIKNIVRDFKNEDPLWVMINVELKNRLPELLLMRADKMTMAHSIEARVPFLDEDLVEFALRLPSSFKRKQGESKYLLKKAAEGILPKDIIYRHKRGFCGSATTMLSPKVLDFARDAITGSKLVDEIFRRSYIDKLFKRHQHQKRFNSFKIWNLMNLVLWHDYWFENW